MKEEVSEFDKKAYLLIRDNVSHFITDSAKKFDSNAVKILDVAPQDHAGAKHSFLESEVLTADIDPSSDADYIIDICQNNQGIVASDLFDIIVCTEVLEHTLNPFSAVDEIYRMLKPGGLLLMTTPFNFRIHGPLPDCWRFTEHGIRALLKDFEIVELNALEDEDRFLMPIQYTTIAKKV